MRLHRLVYLAATAGAIHFYWLVKRDKQQPELYLFFLTVLLGWRVALWLAKTQKQRDSSIAKPAPLPETN